MAEDMKKFTVEELKTFNGQDGRPTYVAYKGRVIDVTNSKLWKGGQHMKRHAAGQDLTAEIGAAPHGLDVLDRFPQVGVLVTAQAPAGEDSGHHGLRAALDRMFERYPFLERHPHPMTVHFPIVFFIFAPLFTLLDLITGVDGFDFSALSCLGGGLLFSLVVIPTGFLTWIVNYDGRPMKQITIKITGSLVLFVLALGAFIWRLMDPTIIHHVTGVNVLYVVLVFLLLPIVAVVATYGAALTFPVKKRERVRR